MKPIFILLFFLCFRCIFLWAQSPYYSQIDTEWGNYDWRKYLKENKLGEVKKIIDLEAGKLALMGLLRAEDEKGSAMYLQMVNDYNGKPHGDPLILNTIFHKTQIHAALQISKGPYKGHCVFVGNGISKKKKEQLWFAIFDPIQETLRYQSATLGEGRLTDVLEDENGDIWVTGQKDKRLRVWRWKEEILNCIFCPSDSDANTFGQKLLQTKNGQIHIVANRLGKKKKEVLIKTISKDGTLLASQSINNAFANDACLSKDQKYIGVTGYTFDWKERENLFFYKANQTFTDTLFAKSNYRFFDVGIQILPTQRNTYLIRANQRAGINGFISSSFFEYNEKSKQFTNCNIENKNVKNEIHFMLDIHENQDLVFGRSSGQDLTLFKKNRISNTSTNFSVEVHFTKPLALMSGKNYISNLPKVEIEATIVSKGRPIKKNKKGIWDLRILAQEASVGGKSGLNPDIIFLGSEQDSYRYFLSQTLELEDRKKNDFYFNVVLDNDVLDYGSTFSITQSSLNNLFVLAIGPPFNDPGDLQYTDEDAENFARFFIGAPSFKKQHNTVFANYLTSDEDTKPDYLKSIFEDLAKNKFPDPNAPPIKTNDVLIVFISTHGFVGDEDGEYKLKSLNYYGYNHQLIDFKMNVWKYLELMHCKKLLLLDACYSAAGGKGENKNINKLLENLYQSKKSLTLITSSSADEKSWEVGGDIQNGLFTESILEAFSGTVKSSFDVDIEVNQFIRNSCKNHQNLLNELYNDDYLTVYELFSYIEVRVPFLAKVLRETGQNPKLFSDLKKHVQEWDYPIYKR